jgi:hypothetical protein
VPKPSDAMCDMCMQGSDARTTSIHGAGAWAWMKNTIVVTNLTITLLNDAVRACSARWWVPPLAGRSLPSLCGSCHYDSAQQQNMQLL